MQLKGVKIVWNGPSPQAAVPHSVCLKHAHLAKFPQPLHLLLQPEVVHPALWVPGLQEVLALSAIPCSVPLEPKLPPLVQLALQKVVLCVQQGHTHQEVR